MHLKQREGEHLRVDVPRLEPHAQRAQSVPDGLGPGRVHLRARTSHTQGTVPILGDRRAPAPHSMLTLSQMRMMRCQSTPRCVSSVASSTMRPSSPWISNASLNDRIALPNMCRYVATRRAQYFSRFSGKLCSFTRTPKICDWTQLCTRSCSNKHTQCSLVRDGQADL